MLGLLTVLVWLGFSDTALATCGDWLDHPVTVEPQPLAPAESPSQPCDGPQCRQAPALPALPLPLSLDHSQRDLACLDVVDQRWFAGVRLYALAEHDACAQAGFPFVLERPPKA